MLPSCVARLPHLISRTALIVVIASSACSTSEPLDGISDRTLPLIKGRTSPTGFMPAVGALVINVPGYFQSFCTGTLIAKRWVITAAHCLESSSIPAFTPLGVFFGDTVYTSNPGKTIVPIKNRYPHPSFKGGNAPNTLADWYDIGLIELESDVPIEPMKLIRPTEVGGAFRLAGDMTVVGFGLTQANNPQSSGTKHDGVMQLMMVEHSEFYLEQKSGVGTTTCSGDSGGPTFVNVGTAASPDWRHIGVTSRGAEGCDYGTVQTRTDAYLDWIHSTAKDIPCASGKNPDCGTQPPPPAKKKDLGETCTSNSDCESNLCPSVDGKSICAQICDTRTPNCPTDFICRSIDSGGIKGLCVVGVAVPPSKKGLGDPCSSHDECDSKLCASQGAETFCTKSCTPGDGTCGSLECLDVGGGQSICAKGTSEGGCAVDGKPASSAGGLISILCLLGLALVVRWHPRRR